jgi:hypothetical protein
MKASEESDSLPTDPEDESNVPYVSNNFHEVFRPHRDRKLSTISIKHLKK